MGSSRKLKNLSNIKSETTEGSSDGVSILTVLKDKLFPVGYEALEIIPWIFSFILSGPWYRRYKQ